MNQARSEKPERPAAGAHHARTAILVLSCLDEVYSRCTEAARNTWAAAPSEEVDVFFVYGVHNHRFEPDPAAVRKLLGHPVPDLEDGEVRVESDVILCGCSDHVMDQSDCLLRKRLMAFGHLANVLKYDYIYTVCASSYVDSHELAGYVRGLPPRGVYHGPLGICGATGHPFVSGSSMLLSSDLAAFLAGCFEEMISFNEGAYADDVTIGYWIAEHHCQVPIPEICRNIHAGQQGFAGQAFVLPYGKGMTNFVERPVEEHLPTERMYHYHFDSRDIGKMEAFHQKFFQSIS